MLAIARMKTITIALVRRLKFPFPRWTSDTDIEHLASGHQHYKKPRPLRSPHLSTFDLL
jgi:hypothetical protein